MSLGLREIGVAIFERDPGAPASGSCAEATTLVDRRCATDCGHWVVSRLLSLKPAQVDYIATLAGPIHQEGYAAGAGHRGMGMRPRRAGSRHRFWRGLLRLVGVDEPGSMGGHCRVARGSAARRLSATERKSAASWQALAKATRTRLAVSMTRAATLSSRRRIVVDSAVRSAAVVGMACRTVHISQ
jgi:hypothetical protein